ncbi:MAG: FAD-dependent oxidoreductase [Nocardioides sp.]|jgi:NADPH-dependent 2,4-dienoyl-CoA reductase/sulfur reductase-like enzyme
MQRIVVIGADATGMSAAHQALRRAKSRGQDVDIVVLEQTQHTSYSACGIPYWIAGDVDSGADLVARTAQEHRDAGLDLRLGAKVTAVDLAARTVTVGGERLSYDDLVFTTGAHPIVPDWARVDQVEGVAPVKTLDDGAAWLDRLSGMGRRVVIAGGGYIGVEMAETALRRGHVVSLITRSRVMSALDPDMGELVAQRLRDAGVEVLENAEVRGLVDVDGRVSTVDTTRGSHDADLVVLAMGVRPNTELLAGQVDLADSGALRPDGHGRVTEHLWAAGDNSEVRHRVTGEWAYLPLGTHANKHGRALGDSVAGGDLTFDGALGTAITRFAYEGAYAEISCTGLSEAQSADLDTVAVVTEGTTASGYLPDAEPITIKMRAERGSRRLLGVQIVGGHGAGKRIDTAAAVLWHRETVDDLAWMDLSYAPPFATAWEILQIAARRVAERL